MSTINRIGWALIYAGIASWIAEVTLAIWVIIPFSTAIAWTYVTLFVILVGIFMAQYKPYVENMLELDEEEFKKNKDVVRQQVISDTKKRLEDTSLTPFEKEMGMKFLRQLECDHEFKEVGGIRHCPKCNLFD